MTYSPVANLTTEELKSYLDSHHERDFLIVDVRQPEEYTRIHIPGAQLYPFPLLESRIEELRGSRALIFTCRSGARSRAAATLAREKLGEAALIYNHSGGILGWSGKTLSEFPRAQALGAPNDFADMLLAGIDLEKGAWNFYKSVLEKFPKEPFSDSIEYLSLAESDHAEALYRLLSQRKEDLPSFDDLFMSMPGNILEGGVKLADALISLNQVASNDPAAIMEMALDIEYSAYDLYRLGAEMAADEDVKKILYGIANGEKAHMKKLAEAFRYLIE